DVTGVISEPISWLGSRWTALVAICALGVWKGVGWAMLIFLAALQAVPVELHEAAAVDGAGGWQRLRNVTLPSIRRTLTFVTVLSIIGGFNVFISVYLMTGGGPADQTQVPITYLYRQAFSFLDFGYGSAISFMLTVLVFGVATAQLWLGNRTESEGPA
ncbi:MAG: sugar ABC transporter permease, partial [Acidimicrobiia bacterium]